MLPNSPSPLQIGVGLRSEHYPFLEKRPQTQLNWFEAISENYMNTEGRPLKMLELIRRDYPVALHGVSLSIGSIEEINLTYLSQLKKLIDHIDPILVSDHLCWTGHRDMNLHNLLPILYNDQTLDFLTRKVEQVQSFLGRTLTLENLSAYFTLKGSLYTEWEFMRLLWDRTGCGILLDINNIYVNSINQKFNPDLFLETIPAPAVQEIHLAGHTDQGGYLFDTHSRPVCPEVWSLFAKAITKFAHAPVLIEWDEDIPEFSVLEAEALKAKYIMEHGTK